jgi:hypothetical protein
MHPYQHEAVNLERRQVAPPVEITTTSEPIALATTSSEPVVLTYLTPSPGASPIAITEQSQIETSYIPQMTLCALPPQAIYPVSPIPTMTTMATTWRNYSISIPPGNGTCTTVYSPTRTMVCATTLTGLVQKYTVSDCNQDITFSTEYGYVLASPTVSPSDGAVALASPSPTFQRLTTYYLAPWQAVTAGVAPSTVDLQVCATYANGTEECVHQYELWRTSYITQSATSTIPVNISTTIDRGTQIIVQTFVANVTAQATTFQMTTEMEYGYATEIVTTERETAQGVRTGPTSYMTVTVDYASTSSSTEPT